MRSRSRSKCLNFYDSKSIMLSLYIYSLCYKHNLLNKIFKKGVHCTHSTMTQRSILLLPDFKKKHGIKLRHQNASFLLSEETQ